MNHGTSGECQPDAARVFDRHRGLLVSVAYRVLGSVTDAEDEAMAESVSMAMMVVLETLSPLERAVFVLREALGRPHAEIAEVLGRREDAVRQLARRARERRTRFDTDSDEERRVTERFLEAASDGDLEGLMRALAPDAMFLADNVLSHPEEITGYLEALEGLDGFDRLVVPVGKGLSITYRGLSRLSEIS